MNGNGHLTRRVDRLENKIDPPPAFSAELIDQSITILTRAVAAADRGDWETVATCERELRQIGAPTVEEVDALIIELKGAT